MRCLGLGINSSSGNKFCLKILSEKEVKVDIEFKQQDLRQIYAARDRSIVLLHWSYNRL